MNPSKQFWRDRTVFLTGHTGFKGAWIALWMTQMGAKVHGYSLNPPTNPSFFDSVRLDAQMSSSIIGDIRDQSKLFNSLSRVNPSVVIHMAAQPLVKASYIDPVGTFSTNIIGTLNLFEAVRRIDSVRALVNVTSDKCYENLIPKGAYRETDRLGGGDPYSCSKACSELLTEAYRRSYFENTNVELASVRAGNVIGGGDWAADRLVPDLFRAIHSGHLVSIRSPNAVRPWQHVLEPLNGYLVLAEKLVLGGGNYSSGWNFGPNERDAQTVLEIVKYLQRRFPQLKFDNRRVEKVIEAPALTIDSSKAKERLGWSPRWPLSAALDATIEWYRMWENGGDLMGFSSKQIDEYIETGCLLSGAK
jgi:CDP-glucose 4,6-dehydratase